MARHLCHHVARFASLKLCFMPAADFDDFAEAAIKGSTEGCSCVAIGCFVPLWLISIFGVLGSLDAMRQYGDGPGALIFCLIVLLLPVVVWLSALPENKTQKETKLKDDDESIAGSIGINQSYEDV